MNKNVSPSEAAKQRLLSGDLRGAEAICREALAANPFDARATAMLGAVAEAAGNGPAALDLLDNAISMDGSIAEFHNSRAIVLKKMGRLVEARAAYEMAIDLDPDHAGAAYNFAILLREAGEFEKALYLNSRAVELEPNDARFHNNLGITYHALGRFEEAAETLARTIKLDRNHAGGHGNLAAALAELDQPAEALKIARKALKRWPQNVDILNGECNALMRLNRWEEALAAADRTLAVDQNFAQAHYARGWILLALERFQEGWGEYDWREKRSGFWPKRPHSKPRWSGEDLADKTLLVHWEQGFGDTLQFVRYLAELRSMIDTDPRHRGANLVFDCPASLFSLLEGQLPVDQIGSYGEAPPDHDYQVLLLNLPGILGTTAESIPSSFPYIRQQQTQPTPLPSGGSFKVGLVWTSDHKNTYRRKVIPVDLLERLFDISDVYFFGLQVGAEAQELEPYAGRANVHNWGPKLKDFADTASVVDHLDLVLCIDTAVGHLAGAMDKPAWMLLPFSPDWRWGLEGDSSPWYPSIRLFRQPAPGDWETVIDAVENELREAVK